MVAAVTQLLAQLLLIPEGSVLLHQPFG